MSISELTSQVADLSLADKLALIDSVIASIRKEGVSIKKAKGDKVASDKPKRKAALGTLAWTAYVKHMKATQPEAFEGITKESEKLVIVKGIRADDAEGYKTFTDAWKAEHAEESASASEAETESVAEPAPAKVAKVAAAKVDKPKAAPKVEKTAPKVEKTAPKVEKAAPKVEKAAPKVEKAAAAPKVEKPAAAKPVKTVKKVVNEEVTMPQKEIDGTSYWHEPESNGLWEVTDETPADGTGNWKGYSWVGYFQPGNEEEPIRFTEAFGSD